MLANFGQLMGDFFPDLGGVAPSDTTIVGWLPFYHDMGLMLGVIAPILGGYHAEIMSPVAFLAEAGAVGPGARHQYPCVLGGTELRVRTGGA